MVLPVQFFETLAVLFNDDRTAILVFRHQECVVADTVVNQALRPEKHSYKFMILYPSRHEQNGGKLLFRGGISNLKE